MKILENDNIPHETINNYFHNLSYAILNKRTYDNFDRHDYLKVTSLLRTHGFNTERLMKILAQPCSSMLIKCEWQNVPFDCETIFKQSKSSLGFCCSFNHKGVFFPTHNPTIDTEDIYVGGVGNAYGLTVHLDVEESQYMTTEPVGFSVLVHNSVDYPDVSVYGIPLDISLQLSLAVRASVTSSKEELRHIDVKTRDCIFTSEDPIPWSIRYTYGNCLKRCEQEFIWRYCRCTPFYYYIPTSRYCSILDVSCVIKAGRASKKKCKCRSPCNEISYTSIIQGEQPIAMNSLNSATNISIISVYFENSGVIHFHRSENVSWSSLLASIGGVFGLFLGGSIMSIIEFLYHIILGIFKNRIRTCNLKRMKDHQQHHPNIFTSELYPKGFIQNRMSDKTTPIKWKM